MGLLTRLVVVGWMVGGFVLAMFAFVLPALLAWGAAAWWPGPRLELPWLEGALR
jgi:hypothetical protein